MELRAILLLASWALAATPYEEGLEKMKAGKLEEAIVAFEEAADAEPGSADVLMNLGWAYWRARRLDDAWRQFDLLVKLDPKNPSYLRLLADVEDERGNLLRALTLARRALELVPGDRDSALSLAKVLIHLERNEEATRILERLIQQYPEHPGVQFRMADHLQNLGRLEEALVYYDRLVHHDPRNPAFRRGRAGVLYELGHVEEAMEEWRVLASLPTPDEKSMINIGWASWHGKDFEQAGKYGSMLVELEPNNPRFLKFLASIRLEQKNPEEALKLARRALGAAGNDRDASLLLAKSLFHLQREDDALGVMKGLLERFPDNASLQFHMADFLAQMGRYEDALLYLERLVKETPANRSYRKRHAFVLYELGRFQEAREVWRLLAQQKPPDAHSITRLADDAYNRDDFEEALKWMRQLGGAAPLTHGDWVKLAMIYQRLNRLYQAIDAADKAIELDSHDLTARYLKGELYEQVPDLAAAERVYEEILSRNPNSYRAIVSIARVAERKGQLSRAIKLIKTLRQMPLNSKAAGPYLAIEEARLLGEARRMADALGALKPISRRHRAALPALLYHGISKYDRKDNMTVPLTTFKAQMKALEDHGYTPITVTELAAFGRGDGTLPDKPILITFDDGRVDGFRNADPVFEEYGFKATMFSHLAAIRRGGFNANPRILKEFGTNGRWDIQAHGDLAHDPMRVTAGGHTSHFLSNRKWLPEEGRLETLAEYEERLDTEYRTAKEQISFMVPGSSVVAFAYPFGDNGQADGTNAPDSAARLNQKYVRKYYSYSFIQDAMGYNLAPYDNYDLTRFEIKPDLSAGQLIRHLQINEPWVKANMLEASLWTRSGQPGRALAILDRLEAYGVREAEVMALRGQALRRLGNTWDSERLYARAAEMRPELPRYTTMLSQAREASGPSVGTEAQGFSDPYSVNTRALARGSIRLARAHVSGFVGRGRYEERAVDNGDGDVRSESRLLSEEGGGRLKLWVTPSTELNAGFVSRVFSEQRARAAHGYDLSGSAYLIPSVRATLSHGRFNVETPRGLLQNIWYRAYGGQVAWDIGMAWIVDGGYQAGFFNDGNEQAEVRAGLTRRILNQLSVGYAYRGLKSDRRSVDYYSPTRLDQHMGVITAAHSFGRQSLITGLRRFEARAQYGAGYGWLDRGERAIHSVRAGLTWRLVDRLSLTGEGQYTMSPEYISRTLNAGLGFHF